MVYRVINSSYNLTLKIQILFDNKIVELYG